MSQQDQFDRIVSALHEAALDDTVWPSASTLIADTVHRQPAVAAQLTAPLLSPPISSLVAKIPQIGEEIGERGVIGTPQVSPPGGNAYVRAAAEAG